MFTRKRIIIAIVAGFILLGTALAFVFLSQLTQLNKQADSPGANTQDGLPSNDAERKALFDKRTQRYDEAVSEAIENGPEAGQQALDKQLDQQQDSAERADIYAQKAILSQSSEGGADYAQAIAYAYQADAEHPTYGTALFVADLEYYHGDKAKALQYYKLYLERLTPEAAELNPGDKAMIEARVAELEKGV